MLQVLVTVARHRDRDSDSEHCYVLVVLFLWPPHYIFALWFLSSIFFYFLA